MQTSIQLKQLDPRAITPTRGSADAACYDLYALEDVDFEGGEIKLVRTGWAAKPPSGCRLNIYVRSSTPIKKGFILANSVGIVDADYRGELFVQLMNVAVVDDHQFADTKIFYTNKINAGDRIAQIEVVNSPDFPIEVVTELDETERGTRGIGSTGD